MSGKHLPPEDRKSRPRPGRASTCADWRPLEVLEPRLLLSAAPVLGDLDGNGVLDAFDTSAFELALADAPEHKARFPGVDLLAAGDANGDGRVDAFDAARLFQSDRGQGASASADVANSSAPSLTAALAQDTGHSDTDLLTNDPAIAGQVVSEHPIDKLYLLWTHPRGDLNGDGSIDAFDIAPLELALAHPEQYAAEYPGLDAVLRGDMNRDGRLDAFDVVPYEVLLAGGGGGGEPPPPFPGFDITHALAGDGSFHLSRALIEETVSAPLEDRTHVFGIRAVDDQGNSSEVVEVSFTLDTAAPVLTAVDPPPGASRPQWLEAITLTFTETLDTAAITPAHFTLTEAGEDGQFNTGDEVTIPITDLAYSKANARVTLLTAPLALGTYRLETAAGLPDPAGNELEAGQALTEFVMRVDNPGYRLTGAASLYDLGDSPAAIVVGDVNGDGHLDLVAANRGDDTISILMGDGFGAFIGFDERLDLPTAEEPTAVALGDVNGDGAIDIVVANHLGESVTVFLGQGAGNFAEPVSFAVAFLPVSVTLEDVNLDGHLDIITANWAHNVSILLGDGTGLFAEHMDVAIGSRAHDVAVGDVNGDQIPDLVVANIQVSVFLGTGDGQFGSRVDYPAGSDPRSVVLGDVNGDGFLDIVSGNYGFQQGVSVLLGNGLGEFGEPAHFSTGGTTLAIELADMNGDGFVDVVAANYTSRTLAVLEGDGTGDFSRRTTHSVRARVSSLALADLNQDGALDIVSAAPKEGIGIVFLAESPGEFITSNNHSLQWKPFLIEVSDVDGDGNMDILALDEASSRLVAIFGDGEGGFASGGQTILSGLTSTPVFADVNRDGHPDLVTGDWSGLSMRVHLADGLGGFGDPVVSGLGLQPVYFSLGDVNGDGILDVAIANGFRVSVLYGAGDGSFGNRRDFGVNYDPLSLVSFEYVELGDLNGDGHLDILGVTVTGISIMLGDGVGGFGRREDLQFGPVGPWPELFSLTDINDDGHLDILAVSYSEMQAVVAVMLGDGRGGFGGRTEYGTGLFPHQLILADIDADGDLDILTVNAHMLPGSFPNPIPPGSLSILLGDGQGGFSNRVDYDLGRLPHSLAVGDIDHDGELDILIGNYEDKTVSILRVQRRTSPLPG